MFIIRRKADKTIRDTTERENTVVLFRKLPEWSRNYKTFRLALRTLQIRTDSLFTDTLLWMQSTNDCSRKKNEQDGVHLQVTLKLLSKTNDNSI